MKNPLRILHLEDDPLSAELVNANLLQDGIQCEVVRVDTRQGFISALEDGGFDLILADYSLPSFDGVSALAIASGKRPGVPYIFVSGQMGEEVAVEALKKGAADYVLKSGLFRLASAVRRAIREAEEHAELRKAEEEKRRLEERLRHTQKLESLGLLAGGIAHDFNNLLTTIMGHADIALSELPADSRVRETIHMIQKAAEGASALARQMLAYSGKARLVKGPVNLNTLVKETSQLLKASVSKKAVVEYDFTPEDLHIEADSAQLQQVVMNLITNASDALGGKAGAIKVSTGVMVADHEFLSNAYMEDNLPEGPYAYMEVSDTGCGMDTETRKRIFDPFFTTKFTGHGLGLSAVLGIVRGHRGAIFVESGPGMGTTFRALFPVIKAAPKTAEKEQPAYTAGGKAHGAVMVVDDDESVLNMAGKILESAGYSVVLAKDGLDALNKFRVQWARIDLVLLDMTMPNMSGAETFAELRNINPDVRVILSSGYTEEEVVVSLAERGAAHFIQKPYRMKALISKVGEVLR